MQANLRIAMTSERLKLLNDFYRQVAFSRQAQLECSEQYAGLPDDITDQSIFLGMTLLLERPLITPEHFLNMLAALRSFARFFASSQQPCEQWLYQQSYESTLPQTHVVFLQTLFELRIYPQEQAIRIFSQMRDPDSLNIDYFLDVLRDKFRQDINFHSYADSLVAVFSILVELKIPVTQDVINFIEKNSTDRDYSESLNMLHRWLARLSAGQDVDESNAIKQILSVKSRSFFNTLVQKKITFSAQDLLILIDTEGSHEPVMTKILRLHRAGLSIAAFDIKNYLANLSRHNVIYLETKLLPILQRYQLTPSISALHQLLIIESRKIDIAQELDSYLLIHIQEDALFDTPYWQIFCLCMMHEMPYTKPVGDFLCEFEKIRSALIKIIKNQLIERKLADNILKSLYQHQFRLREIDSLATDGYEFDEVEILALIHSKDYTAEGLRVLAQIKTAVALQTIAPLIQDSMRDLSHVKKILQLLQHGFEFSRELVSVLKSAAIHASELTELLILVKNKHPSFDLRYIQMLNEAQENSFFLLKGFLNFGLQLTDFNKSELKQLYVKGFCLHYGVSVSQKFITSFLDNILMPSVELGVANLREYEEAFSLLKDYRLSYLIKISRAVLLHSDPVSLAKSYGILNAAGFLNTRSLEMLKAENTPEPLAIAFAMCMRAGVQPTEAEISILLAQETLPLAEHMAEVLIWFHQQYSLDKTLSTEQLFALSQSADEALYLLQGWLVAAQHPEQGFDVDDNDFMIDLGLFYGSFINIAVIRDLMTNSEDDQKLRQALIDLVKAKILLTEEKFYELQDASQNDAEAGDELLDGVTHIHDALNRMASEAQKPWLDHQHHRLSEALRAAGCDNLLFPEFETLTMRYATESLFQRENIFILRQHIELIIDFLMSSPRYLKLFEEIAGVYNTGCVNQPVQGLLEISSWIFVAQQHTPALKLHALTYRYTLEHITAFVEEQGGLGHRIKAEAANQLLIEIEQKLRLMSGKSVLWPNIPRKIAYQDLVANFMESTQTKDFINRIAQELNTISDETLIDYVLNESRAYHYLWGSIMFPAAIDELETFFATKRRDLSNIAHLKLDFEMNYFELVKNVSLKDQTVIEQIMQLSVEEITAALSQGLVEGQRALYEKVATFHRENATAALEYSCDLEALDEVYRGKSSDDLYDELRRLDGDKFSAITTLISKKTYESFCKKDMDDMLVFSEIASLLRQDDSVLVKDKDRERSVFKGGETKFVRR